MTAGMRQEERRANRCRSRDAFCWKRDSLSDPADSSTSLLTNKTLSVTIFSLRPQQLPPFTTTFRRATIVDQMMEIQPQALNLPHHQSSYAMRAAAAAGYGQENFSLIAHQTQQVPTQCLMSPHPGYAVHHHQQPFHQTHHQYNAIMPADKMWEDISASISDDYAVPIKAEMGSPSSLSLSSSTFSHSPHSDQMSSFIRQQQHNQSHHNQQAMSVFASPGSRQPLPASQSPIHYGTVPTSSSYGSSTNVSASSPITSSSSSAASMINSRMHHLLCLPPTPPNSEPGSPGSQQQQPHNTHAQTMTHARILSTQSGGQQARLRRTPPPPYAGSNESVLPFYYTGMNTTTAHRSGGQQVRSSHQRSTGGSNPTTVLAATFLPAVQKYNRRNNPELEKRRIHHCDFPGEYGAAHYDVSGD